MVCAPFTAATRFFAGCSLFCHDAVQSESGDRLSRRTRRGRTVAEGKLISRIGAFGLLGRPCRVASCHRAERERPAGGEAGWRPGGEEHRLCCRSSRSAGFSPLQSLDGSFLTRLVSSRLARNRHRCVDHG